MDIVSNSVIFQDGRSDNNNSPDNKPNSKKRNPFALIHVALVRLRTAAATFQNEELVSFVTLCCRLATAIYNLEVGAGWALLQFHSGVERCKSERRRRN
jgi:hypothetical protein